MLSLRAVWNANLPIHTLPAEVLLDIFKYSLVPSHQHRYTHAALKRPWAPLMGVCRHWCALIRNDAVFWSTIDISKGTNSISWLDIALRRSHGAPLHVTLAHGCDIEAAISILLPHTNHIKHLETSAPNAGWIKPLFVHGLPILADLAVSLDRHVSYGRSRRGVDFVNRDICPHLETLSLSRYALAWTAPLLTNLRSLSLDDCELSTELLSFAAFLNVLEHGQELRFLELNSFLCAVLSSETSVPSGRLVTLPKLSYLQFHALPSHAAQLLSHLRTLSRCDFEITGECSPNDPSISYASFLPPGDAALAYLTSSAGVYLEVSEETHVVSWDLPLEGSYRLELHRGPAGWDNAWLERGLRQLPALFASAGVPLTELNVAGRLGAVSSTTWDTVFESFPALQSLEFEVHEGSAFPTVIIRSLSVPVTASRPASRNEVIDGSRIRCLALANLTFTMDGREWTPRVAENILTCLHARAAGGAPKLKRLNVVPSFNATGGAGMRSNWEDLRQRLRASVDLFQER